MRRPVPLSRIAGVVNTSRGLDRVEAAERLRRYGANEILPSERLGWFVLVRDTASDPMVWFLLATGILFLSLGDRAEAITLIVATIPLVGMDVFLHRRTRASTEGLATRLAVRANVRRDGGIVDIPASEVVPGDLAIVKTGENLPADGIVVSGDAIQVDESVLTGEAWPVVKQPLPELVTSGSESLVDSRHWLWAGTRMLTGEANVRIVNTGGDTLYGEIVRSARAGGRSRTPLQSAIGGLVGILVVASVLLCVCLALVRYFQGFGVVDAILSALTLAVAALPEEFPVLFTVFLGVGVYRLAQRRALVQRAVVVENIGRVTCICTDKTGTITEGRLILSHDFPAAGSTREALLSIAALASRTDSGDPVDVAILGAAARTNDGAPVASWPFTEARKRETNLWRVADGRLLAAIKGAPEQVLSMCDLDAAELAMWNARIDDLAAGGHKLIACAEKKIRETEATADEPDSHLVFSGVLAFEDPVRDSVKEAVAACRQAGIHVIMITGDHPQTARAVAREIGLGGADPVVMEADDLAGALRQAGLRRVDVIARAIPAQKVEVVRALQSAGEIVAVTGDGVNDVPALQAADIGLAMGEHGTRSAREVAAIVLLDENFRTIIRAIAEGRQLFRNLKLGFAYLLMIHIPLVATAALIPLAGFPLLYLPIHVVWLELIIHPTAMLVFQELPANERLLPTARRHGLRFFDRREWVAILAVGVIGAVMIGAGYYRSLGEHHDVQHARAMTLAMLSFGSAMTMSVLSGLRTPMARVMAVSTVILAVVLIQTPLLDTFLHVEPLHLDDWSIAALGAALLAAIAWSGRFRNG